MMLKYIKRLVFAVTCLFILVAGSLPTDYNLAQILARLNAYNQYRPQEKIYVHVDKPLYAAGEDIWFTTYLLDATFHRPDSISKIVYVELFNANKILLKRHALYLSSGISHGDFHLADTLPAGNYTIRAYTNYMKNVGDDFFFTKEIPVLSSHTEQERPKEKMPSLDVQFFPEGGNLLAEVENRVAFKAIDQQGLGVSVAGEIVDENNLTITTFAAEHDGMGVLKISPFFGKKYRAKIKNSDAAFALPEVTQKNYLLRITEAGSFFRVLVYTDLRKYSSAPNHVYIIAQSRGVASFAAEGSISNSTLVTNIPKSKFPSGVSQLTLFDGAGVPLCERLIFVNHQNDLNISITPNAKSYLKKQKVELDISASTKLGNPAQGYFSMSVYDESKIQDDHKYPTSITSHLLLTSDLKGRIEEPGYYFKDTLPETKHHLDLVMMTHGWRRFAWKTVLSDTLPSLRHFAEQGIVVSGRLLKTLTNRPAKNSNLKILTSNHDLLVIKTDSLGKFYTDNLIYYDSTDFFIQTDNAKGRQSDLKLQLNPYNISPPLLFQPVLMGDLSAQAFLDQTQIINKITQGYRDEKNATLLKAVEVKAKKVEPENNTTKIYGMADATINMKDVPPGYTNVLQALQGRVAGVNISGGNPPLISIRGGGEPLFLLNGMQVDIATISNIPTNDVESIDVLKGVNAAIYGGRGGNGVIAVYTKKGDYTPSGPSIGVHNLKYPGLYKAREFYSPKYDAQTEQTVPDIRNTLYWNPTIKTDAAGKAHLSFFTSEVTSQYKIVLEGISIQGMPGAATHSIIVR